MTITVKIIADSINTATDDRITTFLCRYPRFIHSEIMTHRVCSRNAASSRAIPIARLIEMVENDPAMPVVWGKNQKGMQASKYLSENETKDAKELWEEARDYAVGMAWELNHLGVHKQIANRILEPYAHIETLITATEWGNFFNLRCHKDAQPEFQKLTYDMIVAYNRSTPNTLYPGKWHLPFSDKGIQHWLSEENKRKVVVARAARTSYYNFEGEIDYVKDFTLHDDLLASGHMSPFEHPAKADTESRWNGNFEGWIPYRKLIAGENKKDFDPVELIKGSMFYQEGDEL